MRAHIVLDEKLVEEIDELAGKRRRSAFIEEAIRAKLDIEKQSKALEGHGPALAPRDYPEWDTPEMVSKWVHDVRQSDDARAQARDAERNARYEEREADSH